jgi:hypothetical protein
MNNNNNIYKTILIFLRVYIIKIFNNYIEKIKIKYY